MENISSTSLQSPNQEVFERPLPQAIEAEKSILSSVMRDYQSWIDVAAEARLTPKHFYLPAHSLLFEEILKLHGKGEPIELISLTQKLKDLNLLDKIGGATALTQIYAYSPTAAHFHYHLQLVVDKFILRSVIRTSNDYIQQAHEIPEDVPTFLDQVEQKILTIRDENQQNEDKSIKAWTVDVIDLLDDYLSKGPQSMGLTTGYHYLDHLTTGLKAGEVFVIAARPSMGKTSLMMNIAEHICVDQGKSGLIFSCEMTALLIVQRLLYSRARFNFSQLSSGFKPSKSDIQRIHKASKELSDSKLFIDDTAGITINELRAKARRRKKDNQLDFIAIDYLQLLRSSSRQAHDSREREISEISSGIKSLAKELEIPIIVLSQLNRSPEARKGGTPMMSDLRESGSIEQDADLVGLIYRSEYYAESEEDKESVEGQTELIIAKNRNGKTGIVPLTFISSLTRFESRAYENDPTN